jgi:hypothetical protein
MHDRHGIRAIATLAPTLGLALGIGGCGGVTGSGNDEINVNPLTQEEATESLQRINERPGDPEAQRALQQLRPALDRLNGLLARVEPEAGRIVSFYEPSPGDIMISERGPMDGRRLLPSTESDGQSVVDLYRRLAGTEPPAALIAAQGRAQVTTATGDSGSSAAEEVTASASATREPAAENGGTARVTSALTADDGAYFRDHGCFVFGAGYGDSTGCFPNWSGGGYAQGTTKTSFFTVAPFSGDGVSVRMQYSGSTKFQDPVFVGDWLSWSYHSSTHNTVNGPQYDIRTHRWDILQASVDGFHWSYAFKWNCSGTYACNEWPVY